MWGSSSQLCLCAVTAARYYLLVIYLEPNYGGDNEDNGNLLGKVIALVIANTLFQQHKRRLYIGHQQMVNTEIRLIIFFAAKDGEALKRQQKQDQAQVMNSLLPNPDLN